MIGPIKPFNSFSYDEYKAVSRLAASALYEFVPLSGYLAGKERGGDCVVALEDEWANAFHVKHAIAVNSATSGLMAAAFAIGLKKGDQFVCPAMTMSATAAAPMFTGATPIFIDVDDEEFGIDTDLPYDVPVFATNLFGHPARLHELRKRCDLNKTWLIEDNSQSPFAMEHGKYAGTIGHIGVFSLNIHKPIQCGEGGVVVTDNDDAARRIRSFINHGENGGGPIGLNLRMPEVCAAIARVQLQRGEEIIGSRIDQAVEIGNAVGPGAIPGLRGALLHSRKGCRNVFYAIPFLVEKNRAEFCEILRAEGVPVVEGYVPPIYRLPAFAKYARPCPVAEDLHDRRLLYVENCAYDFTPEQIRQIGDAFKKAAEKSDIG